MQLYSLFITQICVDILHSLNGMIHTGPGSSPDPCSNVYQGTKAFSEPETRAMADLMLSFEVTYVEINRQYIYSKEYPISSVYILY